jgi:hypothetical protein
MEMQQFKGSLRDLFNQVTNKEKIEQSRINRTMTKTINVLCFLPSYGGHFLSTLLSLNSNTVPLKEITDDSQRVSAFKYGPLPSIIGVNGQTVSGPRWNSYHGSWRSPLELINELYQNHNFSSVTVPIHPVEFYLHPVYGHDSRTQTNYIQVSLDAEDKYIIDRFNRYFFLATRDGEDVLDKKFAEEFSPTTVSLSQIMRGETEFLEEYNKLCTAIGQEPHASALELYQSWRVARKIDLFKM